jgi:glucose-6-phosphate isomerase
MSNPTQTPEWQALKRHAEAMETVHMRDLFVDDPERFDRFSLRLNGMLLDYSKNRITPDTMRMLLDLVRRQDVEGWRDRMFAGEKINTTENRAVLHTALRNRSDRPVMVDGVDVMPDVRGVLERMAGFAQAVRDGT